MTLAPHTIKSKNGSRRRVKRVGRGNASGKGMTSGRGMKGQRSRSGGKSGIARRAFRDQLQKMKKVRGFTSMHAPKQVVTLATLSRIAQDRQVITPAWLHEQGVISSARRGIKIVARGELKTKVTIQGCVASKIAAEAIEKAGGTITF